MRRPPPEPPGSSGYNPEMSRRVSDALASRLPGEDGVDDHAVPGAEDGVSPAAGPVLRRTLDIVDGGAAA